MSRVLVVPDLHCPWHHPAALDHLLAVKRQWRCDRTVFLGDEIDAASWSRHPKDPALPGPADELRLAIAALAPFRRAFPKAYVCNSNHPARVWKQARTVGLPDAFLKSPATLFGDPKGWFRADRVEIDGVTYQHGDGFSGPLAHARAASANRARTVIGHVHAHAGIAYLAGPRNRIWGANAGCLIDPAAPAFDYAKWSAARPALGCAVVLDGVPHLLPL